MTEARDPLAAHLTRLKRRIAIATIAFVAFVIVDVSAALIGRFDELAPVTLGLLIVSVLVMPRSAYASKEALTDDAPTRDQLARVQRWLITARLILFVTALALFLLLPKLL